MANATATIQKIATTLSKSPDMFEYPAGVDYSTAHAWYFAFEQLDRDQNFSLKFRKTRKHWSRANWEVVAAAVKDHLYPA